MSIRIKEENTTQEELNYAIGTDTINGVEMAESLDEKGASKGPYTHVTAEVI